MLINSITELIGNTPVLRIDPKVHGLKNIDLYAKLELFNPFGSLKDRMAWNTLKNEIDSIIQNKQTLIESSSGNTAKALSVLAAMYGTSLTTVTDRIKVPEVKKILQILGTTIEELPGASECPDLTDPQNPISFIERKMVKNPNEYFHTAQYTNPKNHEAHFESTGPELIKDLESVDYFIATLGTTGSSRGTAEFLKEQNITTKIVGVISTKDDFIPGIRNADETMEVGIYKKDLYDETMVVDSLDALEAMRTLNKSCGILAGPTSGASYLGALEYLREVDKKNSPDDNTSNNNSPKKKAVFIVCDRLEWYVSYIEKRKPEWFGYSKKEHSIREYQAPSELTEYEISPEDAQDWIAKKAPIIIDTRGSLGFKTMHIAGSINIPDKQLIDLFDDGIPFSQHQPILFVCPSGHISKRFAGHLLEISKKDTIENKANTASVSATKISNTNVVTPNFVVKSVQGGLLAWRQAGFPLEK